jgi:hypothetical protein
MIKSTPRWRDEKGGSGADEGENLFVQQRKGVVDPNYILLVWCTRTWAKK